MSHYVLTESSSDAINYQLTQYNKHNLIQKARAYVSKRDEVRNSLKLAKDKNAKEKHGNNSNAITNRGSFSLLPLGIKNFNDLLKKEMNCNQKAVALYHMMNQLNKMKNKYFLREHKLFAIKENKSIPLTSNQLNSRSCKHLPKNEEHVHKEHSKHRKLLTEIHLNKNFNIMNTNTSPKNKKVLRKLLISKNDSDKDNNYYFPSLPVIHKVPSISHMNKPAKENRVNKIKNETISVN